jgi:hypothetical protein
MDLLEEELTPAFEAEATKFFSEPWNAVYDYANLLLDRSNSKVRQFLLQHARRKLNRKETVTALKLLEMQRFLTLSFTSCGWFFDDMAGIETRQILQYAGRTLQLAEEIFQADYEQPFVSVLAAGKSNRTQFGTGRQIYEKWVKEAKVDLLKVGAHYALCSLFDKVEKESSVYVYTVDSEDFEYHRAGRARLSIGKARISSTVTHESTMLTFGVLGMGNHTLVGGVRHFQSEEAYLMFKAELRATLERVDFPEVIRALDRHFGKAVYSLASLFVEEQRRILKTILDSTLSEVEASLSDTYRRHNPLMRYLENQGIPLPEVFGMTAQFVLNTQLRRALKAEEFDPEAVRQLLAETASHGIKLDTTTLNYHFQSAIEKLATRAFKEQRNRIPMEKLGETIELNRSGPLQANLWKVQNLYYDAMQSLLEGNGKKTTSTAWLELFLLLGRKLSVRVSDELKLNQA